MKANGVQHGKGAFSNGPWCCDIAIFVNGCGALGGNTPSPNF
jgi:hypothetical protein